MTLPTLPAHRLAERPQECQWLIDQLWGDEAVGIVGGEPKVCKSFLALAMAVSVAGGVPCLGRFAPAQTGRVLLFAAEDSLHVVRQRLAGIAAAAGRALADLDIHVITAPTVRLDVEPDRDALAATIAALKPKLLVLDPFVRLHRIDENIAGEVAPLLAYLRELQRRHHLAVVLVHHARKGGAKMRAGQALRGSSEFHAWGYVELHITPVMWSGSLCRALDQFRVISRPSERAAPHNVGARRRGRHDAARHGGSMLSTIVRTEAGRRRHLATPLGPYLDGFLSERLQQGFAVPSIAANLKWVTSFGEFLAERHTAVADLHEADLEAFAEHYRGHSRRCGPRRGVPQGSTSLMEALRGSLRPLLAYLRATGVTSPAVSDAEVTPYDGALAEYLAFLRVHRGFAELTIEQHGRWGAAFFIELNRRRPLVALSELGVGDVEAVVVKMAATLGRRSRQIMTTNVESLVRYLRGTGQVPRACVPFLPRTKTYALSALPSVIAWSDVERAITEIDRSDALGRRDHAMVLLVATYGLRAAEVVDLRLDDIDWRRGVLRVRQSKTRRTLDLPLVPAVRDALVTYLRDGRGVTHDRHVFLKVHAPHGCISRAILYTVVRKTLVKAGIKASHFGPHALRHARASSCIRSGHSLKTIGDLLGHRVPEATLIYCKVAVEDLRTVALELPEVSS